ncbi:phosphoribosylformylglycinamidine synthase I [Chloroflexota bacterium]
MSEVKTLVLRAPGTNCDAETVFAFEQAGAVVSLVHVNQLINREQKLGDYQIMVIPGGFTYGDDIAAGKVLANEFKAKLYEDVLRFVEAGGLVLGICNGFQVLVKAGIISGLSVGGSPLLTLADNDSGKFECRWVHLVVNQESSCVFTRGIERLYLPVAHGEGKVVVDPAILPQVNIAIRYADEKGDSRAGYPHNPNGSVDNIAAISDPSGRILAIMPHPERHVRGTQHPRWTRLGASECGDGLRIFQNAVKCAKSL